MNATHTIQFANICSRYRRQLVSLPQTKTQKSEISALQAVCDVVRAAPPSSQAN